ncbi:hypothetical protein CR157_17065 [Halomonas sp. LBP4]|nr:hypothetical protein CR157_17065 [Halomonas sp. LBP4]
MAWEPQFRKRLALRRSVAKVDIGLCGLSAISFLWHATIYLPTAISCQIRLGLHAFHKLDRDIRFPYINYDKIRMLKHSLSQPKRDV